MKFIKLNIKKHDLKKVSELIYETETKSLDFYFKDKHNASKRILKLLVAGNNSLGYENVYLVTECNDNIFGILVAGKWEDHSIKNDILTYFKTLQPLDALKFLLFDFVNLMILADLKNDDLYLTAIAVDEKYRGKGVGTFILKKSLELALNKKCKKVVLDVDLQNKRTLRIYGRFGFKISDKKSIKWFWNEKGDFNMEYII